MLVFRVYWENSWVLSVMLLSFWVFSPWVFLTMSKWRVGMHLLVQHLHVVLEAPKSPKSSKTKKNTPWTFGLVHRLWWKCILLKYLHNGKLQSLHRVDPSTILRHSTHTRRRCLEGPTTTGVSERIKSRGLRSRVAITHRPLFPLQYL